MSGFIVFTGIVLVLMGVLIPRRRGTKAAQAEDKVVLAAYRAACRRGGLPRTSLTGTPLVRDEM